MAVVQASVNSYNGHVWLAENQNNYVIDIGQAADDIDTAQPVTITTRRYMHSTFVMQPAIAQSLRIH